MMPVVVVVVAGQTCLTVGTEGWGCVLVGSIEVPLRALLQRNWNRDASLVHLPEILRAALGVLGGRWLVNPRWMQSPCS